MKPLILLSVIVGALFAGFVGATAAVVLGVGTCSLTPAAESAVAPSTASKAAADAKSAEQADFGAAQSQMIAQRVDDLATQVSALRSELEGVRADIARQETPSSAPTLVAKGDEIAAVQREQVVKILEEQKQLE